MVQGEYSYRSGFDSGWTPQVFALLNKSGLVRDDLEQVHRAYSNSSHVICCWSGDQLVGVARMLTDGAMYASIFDVAVAPEHQKRGIGRVMMLKLIALVPNISIHLTSTFGHEDFYRRLGFRSHKTAFALYPERLENSPYLMER